MSFHSNDQRNIETEALTRRRQDPPSGSYRRDRESVVRWMIGIAGTVIVGIVVMVLKHETDLALIKQELTSAREEQRELKSDMKELLKHFGIGKAAP